MDQPTTPLEFAAKVAQRYLDQTDAPAGADPAALTRLRSLGTQLPDVGHSPVDVVELLDAVVAPATMRSTGGRYFGFVNGGTEPAALGAAVLTAAWDQNLALPVMSPGAAHVDAIAARWIVELLGLPTNAVASFCGGASVANLTGVMVGRDALLHRLGWSVADQGLVGAPKLRIVAGAESHISATKAIRLAGLGIGNIEWVPTDDHGRLDPAAMPVLDETSLLVLQAGNVNTGHSDPFAQVLPQARAAGAWTHVDGAFGLWAAATPTHRHEVAGVELADSWATDAHKWLNAPYDSGIAIVRDADDLRRTMATDAAYVETTAERALMHLGIQMSQKARGVETWAALMGLGRAGLIDLIDRTSDLARRCATGLAEAGADILCPPALNQALVAFGDDATTDAVIAAVQDDGRIWAGGTTWHGRRAMRLSVSSRATTPSDIDDAISVLTQCWSSVIEAG